MTHYDKYREGACEWCAAKVARTKEARGKFYHFTGVPPHEYVVCTALSNTDWAEQQSERVVELERHLESEEKSHLVTIDDRDRYSEQIGCLHIQLGGDGEWTSNRDLGEECGALAAGIIEDVGTRRNRQRDRTVRRSRR